MKIKFLTILSLCCFIITACNPAYINTSKNIMHGGANKSINLYAFVGKKISVIEFDPNDNTDIIEYGIDEDTGDSVKTIRKKYVTDRAFRCKYQVIKKMFNDLENDTVEFTAYDHYGTPGFTENDTVILYLSKSKDGSHYFHQKYQYDNVFKDNNGNYFSYPKFNGNDDSQFGIQNIKGFNINFINERFDISHLSKDFIKTHYPSKFYKVENNFAIPIKGIYLYEQTNYRLKTTFKDL